MRYEELDSRMVLIIDYAEALEENHKLKDLLKYFMTADTNSPDFDEKMSEALKLTED